MPSFLRLFWSLTVASLSALVFPAWAQQSYPNRPIKIIVPYGPGAVQDTVARTFNAELGQALGATVIVEGVRNDSDLQTELPQARVNRDQTGIETVFVPGDPALSHISSSLVRQVASLGGDIKLYVPKSVYDAYGRL